MGSSWELAKAPADWAIVSQRAPYVVCRERVLVGDVLRFRALHTTALMSYYLEHRRLH